MKKKQTILSGLRKWIGVTAYLSVAMLFYNPLAAQQSKKGTKQPVVAFEQKPGELTITIGGKPFASYVYEDPKISRPYFAHVKSACGVQVTRNYPPQQGDPQDHSTFHPGIWLSFGDINGNDYWRLKAKVEHEMFVEQPEGGAGKGTFTVRNYYMSTDGKDRVLAELVKYTILVRPTGTLLLTDSKFSAEAGDFAFGDQEEMGLGVRVNTKFSVQYGKGHITNAEGRKDGKETWGKSSAWVDYSGLVDNQYVGVAIMPDPKNFRPSWFHTRDYGLMAANAFGRDAMKQGEKSSVVVKKGETFRLAYGVLIYCKPNGEKVNIAGAYQDYLKVIKE
ncbi:hypothetical protein DYBT9275_05679 [Dyadobacter sp. CECT 9275]|uniref:Methane oxygenase PmoA n=1 Tax=Dyadobacter helix TaxID=2822344 RepID=A0A916JHJ6_9BACT|nr:DUF6807 family protein [Dyadobacter sp. CECT 9275]CAG5016996.1 hypothetical protein DYBT9275_05679 [Dyadobacter sp. CECT 9275]